MVAVEVDVVVVAVVIVEIDEVVVAGVEAVIMVASKDAFIFSLIHVTYEDTLV